MSPEVRRRAPVGAWVVVTRRDGERYRGRVASWGALAGGDHLLALQEGAGQWRIALSEIVELEVIDHEEVPRRRGDRREGATTPPQGGA